MTTTDELPPLPEPYYIVNYGVARYAPCQMEAYAIAARAPLLAEIAALRERAESAELDAARLNWMSTHEARIGWNREGDMCGVWVRADDPSDPSWVLAPGCEAPFDTAREAIDAAIKGSAA